MDTPLTLQPHIDVRGEQPYVAIRATATMDSLTDVLVPLLPDVLGFLASTGVMPAGAPFWRYDLIDMAGELEVEVGVPTADAVTGAGRVVAGVLPQGRYATVEHVGEPGELERVTAELLSWVAAEGLTWDMTETGRGELWGCRLEEYLTDPDEVPDPAQWRTRLAFRLADPTG